VTKRFTSLAVGIALLITCGCSAASKLKVATGDEAKRTVIEHLELKVLAEHSFSVSGLLILGHEVEGFGKSGTKFWEVRRSNGNAGGNIDGLYWVNAVTGAFLQLHPKQLRPEKPLTNRSTGPRETRPVNSALWG